MDGFGSGRWTRSTVALNRGRLFTASAASFREGHLPLLVLGWSAAGNIVRLRCLGSHRSISGPVAGTCAIHVRSPVLRRVGGGGGSYLTSVSDLCVSTRGGPLIFLLLRFLNRGRRTLNRGRCTLNRGRCTLNQDRLLGLRINTCTIVAILTLYIGGRGTVRRLLYLLCWLGGTTAGTAGTCVALATRRRCRR